MHYIYSHRHRSQAMQFFVNISSKVDFILKSYVCQPSRVYQNFHGVPFPRCSQLLPGTGSNKLQFLHSVEVHYFTQERSQLCCTSELHSFPHFLGVGPRLRSKPITALSVIPYVCTILRDRLTSVKPPFGQAKTLMSSRRLYDLVMPGTVPFNWTTSQNTIHI